MTYIYFLIRLWVGKYLPAEHIWVKPSQRPNEFKKLIRMYYRKWVVHPLRRHRTYSYSRDLQSQGCEIIGITGSAGKTTTKEMLAAILSRKFKTVFSVGNIDPVYNIPETVLHTPQNTEKLILEMGIEFPGELNFYTWMTQPTIGILTAVDWTHTEFFGDIHGVLKEKQKLITSLPHDGYAILNYDDPLVRSVSKKTKANVLFFGSTAKADIQFTDVILTPDFKTEFTLHWGKESIQVKLPLLGNHFASLAAASAVVGVISGMNLKEIKKGLETVKNEPHRMEAIRLKNGTILLDDTYNANPFATKGALRILKDVAGKRRKIFVFGEMKELGGYGIKGHREIGRYISDAGISELLTIGDLTRHTIKEARKSGLPKNCMHMFTDKNILLKELSKILKKGDVVLIKASRSMGFDEIVENLRNVH
jgi:UDP-N-acetylmuramoyl-tripeptide--D-alanyl-D-alanine ligase